jgi:hypothetical protein
MRIHVRMRTQRWGLLRKTGFADDSLLSLLLFCCQPFLQFCERGSLERAMKLGRFRNRTDGRLDIVSGTAM